MTNVPGAVHGVFKGGAEVKPSQAGTVGTEVAPAGG